MSKDKYYTPKIEEFHVGFIFDLKRNDEQNWGINHVYGDTSPRFAKMRCYLHENGCRVKYLDRKDIESLGFELIESDENGFNDFEKIFSNGVHRLLYNPNHWVKISVGKITLFAGTIKNKSELKKVLKMIGYER